MFRQDDAPTLQARSSNLHLIGGGGDSPLRSSLMILGRLVLVAAIVGVAVLVGRLALEDQGLTAQAETIAPAPDQSAEIAALRAEVELLTRQSVELRAELALLTGQGGVLAQMIAHLQEQKRINAAHQTALRQLYATTGTIGASLPGAQDAAPADPGGRPVQVTPVARAEAETPQRVVLIPQGDAAEVSESNGTGGDGG
ncbi:MAG: hypothetical protein JJ911_19465 [Rhizobiaceae bacterium]|nr:hypothetical protein [Rhizobiaceae bacterium]